VAPSVLTNTTEAANAGTHSLKTTGRTAGFNGPALNLLGVLSPGTPYQVTVAVRLASGEPATQLIVTMQRTPSGGTNQFDRVVASAATGVTDGGWVTLQGSYSFAGDVTGLLLYVESSSPTASYYIDDFSIVVVPALGCSVPQDNSGIHANFETGTPEGWGPRIGRETVAVTTADAHAGVYSLLTTGRQAAFDGAAINAAGKLCNGSRYVVNLWAKMAPGQPASQLRVSIQRTLSGVTNFNTVVGNTTVTADQWVRLRATYDFVFNYSQLTLYVESASGTASFYIDDFDLSFVPPPVAERDIASVHETSRPTSPSVPRSGRETSTASTLPVEEALQQHHVGERHEVELAPADGRQLHLRDRRRPGRPGEGERHAGPRPHAGLAQPGAGMGVQRTGRHADDADPGEQGPAASAAGEPHPRGRRPLRRRRLRLGRGERSHRPKRGDGFRRSPWFNITGTEYIDRAFQVAHEVAPNAKLYVNDFSTTDPAKRAFLLSLVANLKGRGVPIDGIGHQMHNNVDFPSAEAVLETVNLFAVWASTTRSRSSTSASTATPSPARSSPTRTSRRPLRPAGLPLPRLLPGLPFPLGKISSVTFWGQADDHTWLTSSGRVNGPCCSTPRCSTNWRTRRSWSPSQLPGAGSTAVFSGAYRLALPAAGAGPRRRRTSR
jgi:endo-1,4-beta-xylanase